MCGQRGNPLKTTLQLMSQLLWVVGLVLAMGGVYLLMKYRHYSLFFTQTYILLPVAFTLCSAALLLGTGFLGTWLSLRDSRCLQGLFVYLLVVIFCLGSTASALAYVQSRKLDTETASLGEVFQNYTGSSRDINSRAVDATQEELQCCGVSNYTDWLGASWLNQTGENLVPRSCCNTTFPSCDGNVDEPWKLYHQGCQGKLEMTFQFILRFIMWGSLLGFLTEVVLLSTMAQVMMMMMERQPFRYQVLENS
ncbi:tetraspanin 37 [Fundulus heteroclitus]|uniref:tetraspanin 37 n=1 Tax=Fundulus heteroclitus TaxID=8078 RepID=UPI00165C81DA|nr:tetraspanin 37 [Fundulus heteroclitus]